MRQAIIFLLAFCGGFTIMSVELLGGRILSPWFGSSVHVWGSIITVFMLALSIGYLLGGRLSLMSPSLARFGLLFFAGAILLGPLLMFGDAMMAWVFARIEDPRYGSLVASVLMFGLPTILLGMISPYSVRLLISDTHHAGEVAGRLYFVSTLGSAIGTLGTSFYFVLWFAVDVILIALTTLLLICGCAAWAVDRWQGDAAS